MYDIAHEITHVYNGLGDTPDVMADGASGSGIDWTSVINTGLNVGGQVANTAINANHQNSNTGSNYNAGYNPSTYSPSTVNVSSGTSGRNNQQSTTDYLPWIIGGCGVLALLILLMNNKK